MIKLVALSVVDDRTLDLGFSDGSTTRWDARPILARDTVMTRPLADAAYFRRAFIEGGALAWPNGLEFSAEALWRRALAAGTLQRGAA